MAILLSQEDYDLARINPKVRKDFIRAIDLEDKAEFVSSVVYSRRKDSEGGLMMSYPSRRSILGMSGGKSKITVFMDAFYLQRLSDFLGCLIDHEGTHAELNYKHPLKVLPTLTHETMKLVLKKGHIAAFEELNCHSELLAFENQLANLDKRGKNSDYYLELILLGIRDSLCLKY